MTFSPPVIEQRLSALIPRVRALRIASGLCWLVAAVLGALAFVLLLDAAFGLPAWARGLFLSVWVTGLGVLAWRWVLIPWRAEISLKEVAQELEKRLPDLGERLRAAVAKDPSESPSAIRTALDEDTARRAKTVDLTAALPIKPIAVFFTVAVVPILVALGLAFLVPGSGERIRRVAMPWSRPNGKAEFRVVVRSGEPVVRRGGPVTLSAYSEGRGSPPSEATLIVRDSVNGPESRYSMMSDGVAFHITLPSVPCDFEYRVEIGSAQSGWFQVTAIEAVELTEGTHLDIVPPAYTMLPRSILTSIPARLDVLQYSVVELGLKFNRPAASAHFDWQPDQAARAEFIPLALSADRRSVTTTLPLRQSGILKLVLVSEERGKTLSTEIPIAVQVRPDAPPSFEQLSGISTRPRTVRPTDRIHIAFIARDDTAVASAVLEYVLDSFDSRSETRNIPLSPKGSSACVAGQIDFNLEGLGREGGKIYFRIRIVDNRNLDDPKLTPQEATYPSAGWSELRLDASASPLEQQDVICQRDILRDGLTPAHQQVTKATAEARALETDSAGQTSLAFDHTVRLNSIRKAVRAATASLDDLACNAALTLELRPFAAAIRKIADEPLKQAADALGQAETHDPVPRKAAFELAIFHLTDATNKLRELLERNTKFAQNRLDRMKLTALAADQTALADALKNGPGDLVARQGELLTQLDAIIAGSDELRTAVEAAKGDELRRLAKRLLELADRLHDLDAAARQTAGETRAEFVTTLDNNQAALAKKTAAIFASLETPARLAGLPLPRAEEFLRVAELAAGGRTVEALAELEKHALALDRLATTFDKWAAERTDPRFAAKQLALWQDDLLSRLRAATKDVTFAKLPEGVKAAFRAEQKALIAAVEALPIPPDDGVKTARATVLLHTANAGKLLGGDGVGADPAMKAAVNALNQLAEKTPLVSKRLADALRPLESLRQDWDTSAIAVEQILKNSDPAARAKKLAPHAQQQHKLIARVAALDLPGMTERQTRILTALHAAVRDLNNGFPPDIQASQAWVRRELERLKNALEGSISPETKAAELHRKLTALVTSLDAHGPKITAKLLEPAGPILQDVQLQFPMIVAPETPALLNEARVTLQSAEAALRDAKPEEIRRRIRTAAEALGRLTRRLNGGETDLERIQRLAAIRHQAAEKPKELLFSDEAVRQLGRESEELAYTRVGPAGQTLKKRAVDLYAKLRAKADPDRLGTDLKLLATTLDELSAKMADIAEFATVDSSDVSPSTTSGADLFLPSRPLADSIRALAKDQRTLHAQVTSFAVELSRRMHPPTRATIATLGKQQRSLIPDIAALVKLTPDATAAEVLILAATNDLHAVRLNSAKVKSTAAGKVLRQLALAGVGKPWGKQAVDLFARQEAILQDMNLAFTVPGAAVAEQLARLEELVHEMREFATLLEVAAKSFDPADPMRQALFEAAKSVRDAEKQLEEAVSKAAEGKTAEAEQLRSASESLLREASEKLMAIAPPDTGTAAGETLRTAKRLMQKAKEQLASGSDAGSVEKALREAAQTLREAVNAVGK